jgi:uncharacterized membrane protein YqhA
MIIQIIVTFCLASTAYGLLIDIPYRMGEHLRKKQLGREKDRDAEDALDTWLTGIAIYLIALLLVVVVLGLYNLAGFLIPFIN